MISTSTKKLVRSLRQKKFREQHQLYTVEGEKMIKELLTNASRVNSHRIQQLIATGEWIGHNISLTQGTGIRIIETTEYELKKISNLVSPQPVMALVGMPKMKIMPGELAGHTVLAFESIRDPGNLGTIIRTADWFGISHIVCTRDSTDLYNPKVVQATMGAVARVSVYYADIEQILAEPTMQVKTIYGTFLKGESIYGINLDSDSLFLFGNESHGLSKKYDPYITRKISIPSFSQGSLGSESLNVASAVAVFCSEIRRT